VELRQPAPAADRYGRILAQVYVTGEKDGHAVAYDLLAQGYARVGAHVGNPACAPELLAREQAPGQPSLASGLIRIMSSGEPKAGRSFWPKGVVSRSSKAMCCRSARAAAPSI
jgi:hypothetical protein